MHQRRNRSNNELELYMFDRILSRENMTRAYKRVVGNKGAAGVDGVQTDELRSVLNEQWPFIKAEILEGSYRPEPVRRVEIPKPNGGTRKLGVPTTTDRLIQQGVQQVLSAYYDPTFSEHSYGFRPGRSAHQAIEQALVYVNEGYSYVVDIDLEKRLMQMCRGWIGYFKLADAHAHLSRIDEWVRSRLRYCIWHQWKRVRTRFKALVKLGASRRNAYIWANTRKGGWHTAHSYVMKGTVTNARLRQKGYISLIEMYST